ncbi:MAG: alpha/beta fold hydrolase [Desulfobacteraceae bacterium]|nr:alpha/beta fold hydrolase [Desulfobacteraceae bacterium]MBC2754455.1 alpha/beta fold hydrolase [Desulfobacteraceae bacterium]
MTMNKKASPFYLNGGSTGIMLIHGFTGAPPEMRLIGDYLHQRGITVSAPLLPGHGTYVEDMNRCQWTGWVNHAKQALTELQSNCDTVFIAGLSLGSLITLNLASEEEDLSGAILFSPSIKLTSKLIYLTPILKYLVRKVKKPAEKYAKQQADRQNWSYNERPMAAVHELLKIIHHTRPLLPEVKCPLLLIQSTMDDTIDPGCSRFIYDRIGSADKEMMTLTNSGHCLTIDVEWETAAEKTRRFIVNHVDTQ